MNNSFDFGRFSLLIRRQWLSFGKIYLMSLGIIAGIFIAFYGYSLYNSISTLDPYEIKGSLSFRPFVFICLGLAFLTIISSVYFANLGNKTKSIFELLIPASQLEKFLAAIFYTVVVSVVSYVLVFAVIDFSFVSIFKSKFSEYAVESAVNARTGETQTHAYFLNFLFIEYPKEVYLTLFIPFLLSSAFLLGSIYFKNFHFIKTGISLFIYVLVYILMMVKIMTWMTKDTVNFQDGGVGNNGEAVLKMLCVGGLLLTLIFWGIGYKRLKEKEV